jgi:predicted lipoprotein with Yx(FWY)xxD motif
MPGSTKRLPEGARRRHRRPDRGAPTMRVDLVLALCAVALVAVLSGCGGSSSSSTGSTVSTPASTTASTPTSSGSTGSSASATVSTANVAGLGRVLVNGQGHTLYVFLPDRHAKVTCTGICAKAWPPMKLSAGQKPAASGGAKASLLGSYPDPEGGRVATYAGWPLYTYIGDSSPGQATGQGLNTSGGYWYVIAPSGQMVTKSA